MSSEKERVAIGAKLMDRLLPGWHRVVDLDKLDMSSGAMCLLGQTFGVHAERCLAKEMYPEEWAESWKASYFGRAYENSENRRIGYQIAQGLDKRLGGSMLERLVTKLGLRTKKSLQILEQVCDGHDNKCEWAAEVADRLAKDSEQHAEAF